MIAEETPAAGVPVLLARHRVESPESYESWREYAFSVEPEAEDGAPLEL
jgi:hypothetical protein